MGGPGGPRPAPGGGAWTVDSRTHAVLDRACYRHRQDSQVRDEMALRYALALSLGAAAAAAPASPVGADLAWPPRDSAGVTRYSAPGLLGEAPPTGLALASGSVTKDPANPLFEQDKPWEPRLDNGYPNVVYDPESTGDGPWRLFYGGIAPGGQYMYYANSTDGKKWFKPSLGRYDIGQKMPHLKQYGKNTNIFMFGGGLGVYHDTHEPNASLRYKIAGGSPAGCYSDDGASDCAVATAGSPDGINHWSNVEPLRFSRPWRPDCHTNLFFDTRKDAYVMTTRDFTKTGRDIAITVSGKNAFGGWSQPEIAEQGNLDHQLYSQITWPYYDIYLGIVSQTDSCTQETAAHLLCPLAQRQLLLCSV